MSMVTLLQLCSACIGALGSIFFTMGVVRQDAAAMAKLSGTYWTANPHMISMLAEQRADYIIGAFMIAAAFVLQFCSCLVPVSLAVMSQVSTAWLASSFLALSAVTFYVLSAFAKRLADDFRQQIRQELKDD